MDEAHAMPPARNKSALLEPRTLSRSCCRSCCSANPSSIPCSLTRHASLADRITQNFWSIRSAQVKRPVYIDFVLRTAGYWPEHFQPRGVSCISARPAGFATHQRTADKAMLLAA